MPREKILVLTHNFIRFKEDLAGQFIYTLMKELTQDYEVFVLAPHQKGLKEYEEIDDLKIYRFRYCFTRYENLAYRGDMHEQVLRHFSNKFLFIFFFLAFFFYTLRIVEKNKIKFIHCHWWVPAGVIGYLTSFFAPVKIILTTHGSDVFILRKFRWLLSFASLIFRKAEFSTAVSSYLKHLLIKELKIRGDKIFVFPMPFDDKKFFPLKEKKVEKGSILSIGRLIQRKGYDYLLEACAKLKEDGQKFKLKIIGEGPEERRLKKLADLLGLDENVDFISNLPQNELVYHYNACEIFVLPSITDWKMEAEGLGLVLLEAMSCRVPVIGTGSGGIVDIVQNEKTGLLIPEKDPRALALAIKRYLWDEDLENRMAEGGYRFAQENFTPKATAGKLKGIYQRLK